MRPSMPIPEVSTEKFVIETVKVLQAMPNATILAIGEPGLGKSHGFQQAAEILNLDYHNYNAGAGDGTEFSGIPMPYGDNKVRLYRPQNIEDPLTSKSPTMFCVDDVGTAPLIAQPALYGLFHSKERSINGLTISPSCRIVATTNSIEDNSSINGFSAALLNRCTTRFKLKYCPQSLSKYLLSRGYNHVHAAFILFINQFAEFELAREIQTDPSIPYFSNRSFEAFCQLFDAGVVSEHVLAGACGPWIYKVHQEFLSNFKRIPSFTSLMENPGQTFPDFNLQEKLLIITGLAEKASSPNHIPPIQMILSRINFSENLVFQMITNRLNRIIENSDVNPDLVILHEEIAKLMTSGDDND